MRRACARQSPQLPRARGVKPTVRQSLKTFAIFGVWDGVAPVVGVLIGHLLSAMTFAMSVAGHQIGRTAAHFFSFIPRLNLDLVTGACFVLIAVLMALGITLPLSDG